MSVALHFLIPPENRRLFACLPCGIVGIVLGFGVIFWARTLFRRAQTPLRPGERATALVTSGPYRLSRNPMYAGVVVMLLGIALCVGSLPMLIPPIGFFALMSLVFIPSEEQRLRETFGDSYITYTMKVRRWI